MLAFSSICQASSPDGVCQANWRGCEQRAGKAQWRLRCEHRTCFGISACALSLNLREEDSHRENAWAYVLILCIDFTGWNAALEAAKAHCVLPLSRIYFMMVPFAFCLL